MEVGVRQKECEERARFAAMLQTQAEGAAPTDQQASLTQGSDFVLTSLLSHSSAQQAELIQGNYFLFSSTEKQKNN